MKNGHMEPIPARRIRDDECLFTISDVDDGQGEFRWDTENESLIYICPCGCGELRSVPTSRHLGQVGKWLRGEDDDKPTLAPSIRHLDGCRWHGWLQNGVWTPCGDSGQ